MNLTISTEMKKIFSILAILLLITTVKAQEETIYSVYFEFDKYNLDKKQGDGVVAFIQAIDTTRIESIQIYGYCDDRGKDEYNFILSNNRANTIKDTLIGRGIKNKIIVTIEGKGRIMLEEDIDDISEARSKNRRVDVVVNFNPLPPPTLEPGIYDSVKDDLIVGDRIYLKTVLFQRGSSKLTYRSRAELEKVARLLHKYKKLEFEIQGHVCCTPKFQKEAIDRDTRKRELSKNRAEAVYKFLISKRIHPRRMTFKGYGNTQPLGKGTEHDRRVELVITKI